MMELCSWQGGVRRGMVGSGLAGPGMAGMELCLYHGAEKMENCRRDGE